MTLHPDFFNSTLYKINDKPVSSELLTGQNKKSTLILCQDLEDPSLSDFLKKIMQAVNYNLEEDTNIWDLTKHGIPHWAELSKVADYKKVVLFGVTPEKMGLQLQIPLYKNTAWKNFTFLVSDDLRSIYDDKLKKQYLWRELQLLFK
jgi:hypothetical protein